MRTLIIGGGLSGLALAAALAARGHDFTLIEARDRLGGRILTQHHGDAAFDLGPAWFWQGQPRIAALLDRLGLPAFAQHAKGDVLFEDAQGHVQRGRGFAAMQGALRLQGGLGALVDALAARLPAQNLVLNAAVTALSRTDVAITATLANGVSLTADQVVFALPPRLAAGITFAPALPDPAMAAMRSVKTWMAGQAKAVAVYDSAFWREDGLSGDASSRRGPMVEIHDASPAMGGRYGLFGFIGVPPEGRKDPPALRHHLTLQLAHIFGPKAAHPSALFVTDWAADRFTATAADSEPLYAHPTYGLPKALAALWDGNLHFAGTEVASQFGGYLEGALEAAEAALLKLRDQRTSDDTT
jgi:monoamine oxidase